MQILNDRLNNDFKAGRPVRLELGSGGVASEGFYGLDILPLDGVSLVADLNEPLNLIPTGSVCEIVSHHCLEHVSNIMGLMEEIHRIMKPGGLASITVPHFSNPYYFSDPTHKTFFGLYTMYYFSSVDDQPRIRKVPSFYTKARFRVVDIKFSLMKRSLVARLRWPLLGKLINSNIRWMDWYERKLCRRIPSEQITYIIEAVK